MSDFCIANWNKFGWIAFVGDFFIGTTALFLAIELLNFWQLRKF